MPAIPAVDPTAPPSALERLMRRFVMSGPGTSLAMTLSTRVDPPLLRATRGRISTGVGFPVVLLTVPGRKSGIERTVPLVYFTEGEEVILVASSFGRAKHPAWYLNLVAAGEAKLTAGGAVEVPHRVRETTGPERDRLFALAERLYAGYGLYKQRAGNRQIPVLALTPIDPNASAT
jgi:deazaflavin-dependent oxidoreductase (nitroreductase family)